MLKETPQEKGCLRGCLWSIVIGGGIGGALGYGVSRFFTGNPQDPSLYLLLRSAFAAVGFVVGGLLWGLGRWLCFRIFIKPDQEDVL